MAPQENIPLVANVLSTIGTVFWCVQLIPQIYLNWRRKKTDGMPASMMFLWALGAVPFGVYAVVQNFAIPIQIQPQCFGFFAMVSWGQVFYYNQSDFFAVDIWDDTDGNSGWSALKTTIITSIIVAIFGGVEALLILTIRIPYGKGVGWPVVLIGVIAAVLLAVGLLPPYYEIWKRRGRVIGISWVFLSIDSLGAIFSLLAIVTQETFDILGGILYILVIVLEGGIFTSHLLWRLRTRRLWQQAKDAGVDFNDLPEARKYQYHERSKPDLEANESAMSWATTVQANQSQYLSGTSGNEPQAHSKPISKPVNTPS